MTKAHLTCPTCENDIIKSNGHEAKLRAKVVKWTPEGMFAVCKSCSTEVPMSADVLRELQSTFVYEVDSEK